jgi:muramoyltetrapeptide carboxypeptidase
VGEPAYRIDRMLQQLASAGGLDGVAGVAVGRFSGCKVPEDADWVLSDVLLDHLERLGVPVVGDLPIGHSASNHAFPWGASARLADGHLAWV